MRNKPAEVLLIILVSEILLIGYSFLYNKVDIAFVKENIRFMTPARLTELTSKNLNKDADSLLQNYLSNTVNDDFILKRTALSKVGPKKQNLFLFNPEVDGGKALDAFFRAMQHEKDSTIVHVAHYGDSQLEGDRMSNLVRDKFHEKFGGSGIGYVPLRDLDPVSYFRNSSGNWAKYTVFHNRNSDKDYGISGAMFRFGSYAVRQSEDGKPGDTNSAAQDTQKSVGGKYYSNASVSLRMGAKYNYNSVSFLYGNSSDNCTVNFYNNSTGELVASDTLSPCKDVCMHKSHVASLLNIKVEFDGNGSPDFFGMYFDSDHGVQVDNYAIRGHSGDGLMMISDEKLKKMLKLTNTRLVIFQYGANVVPYIHSDEACEWISGIYYKLFMKFKKANPDMSILVIGAGDMAKGGEGGYSSYPWLPKITQAQKSAALKAGCAYWDLFGMMGGLNSILAWSDKKLAVSNGHFSEKGQKIVANEMVEALMIEYNQYLHQQRTKK
jgi:lysophospholipase L1-like esterase